MTMELIACVLLVATLSQASAFRPDYRMVGAEEAEPHAYPYTVALYINGMSFCGGVLLSETTVLTAAHCVDFATDVEIVLGAHNLNYDEPTQLRVHAVKFIVHSNWDNSTIQNDIAILRIAAIELNEYIKTIPLPTRANKGNDYANDHAIASGWGRASDRSGSISPVLRFVELTVISNEECRSHFSINTHSHICTSGSGGKSSCNGDSGGPLKASTGELIGIVSFGSGWGCEWGFPPSFTRITEFLDWIAENSDVVVS